MEGSEGKEIRNRDEGRVMFLLMAVWLPVFTVVGGAAAFIYGWNPWKLSGRPHIIYSLALFPFFALAWIVAVAGCFWLVGWWLSTMFDGGVRWNAIEACLCLIGSCACLVPIFNRLTGLLKALRESS